MSEKRKISNDELILFINTIIDEGHITKEDVKMLKEKLSDLYLSEVVKHE